MLQKTSWKSIIRTFVISIIVLLILSPVSRGQSNVLLNQSLRDNYNNQNSVLLTQKKLENPSFFLSSRLVSGNGEDSINDFEWDSDGNTILVGLTTSSNLPMMNSVFPEYSGEGDVFIMKFSKDQELLWSTYLGGEQTDYIPYSFFPINKQVAVAVDENNNIIVAGATASSDFPTKSGFDNIDSEVTNGYITKFSSDGAILWSTYLGGDGYKELWYSSPRNRIEDVTTDIQGNIYVTGSTNALSFYNATDLEEENEDVFVVKLSTNGEILWVYRADNQIYDHGLAITLDVGGNILVVGDVAKSIFAGNDPPDALIFKLDPNGNFLWDLTLGKTGSDSTTGLGFGYDWGMAVETNPNGQILLTGRTDQDLNSLDEPAIPLEGYHGFISLVSPKGEILWVTQIPGVNADFETSSFDNQGNIIAAGESGFDKETIDSQAFVNNYISPDNSKDGNRCTVVAKLSLTGDLIWYTPLSCANDSSEGALNDIYHIDISPDNDILVAGTMVGNHNSFNFPLSETTEIDLTGLSSGFLTILPDPLKDEDGDFLNNLYEYRHGLNFTNSQDAFEDQDKDGLLTLRESTIGTDPWQWDTDNDKVPDGWEHKNDLDPLVDDAQNDPDNDFISNIGEYELDFDPQNQEDGLDDKDFDGMPNYWEYRYGLNVSDGHDYSLDPDSDGLTNYDEFRHGTNPTLRDTDGDGESDGYEVDHGTNPLDSSSYYRKKILILTGVIGFLITVGTIVYFQNRKSKSKGYNSIRDHYLTRRSGFKTKNDKILAENRGFKNKQILNIIQGAGHISANAMTLEWNDFIKHLEMKNHEEKINQISTMVSKSGTPDDLISSIQKSNDIFNEITQSRNKLISCQSLAVSLLNFRDGKIEKYLAHLTEPELADINEKFTMNSEKLSKYENMIKDIIWQKQSWFEPWDRLLSLIRMTQDGSPIHLKEISKVINLNLIHTEELLALLLKENDLIGTYDKESKIYIKGASIEKYLDLVLGKTGELLLVLGE